MSRLILSAVAVVAVLAGTAATPVRAVTYDKLAYLTFTWPVQVPGATLNAGTYRFHLTDPDTSRNVLQVLSNDGATVYAMFHTMPDGRTAVTEDPTVSFWETPAGVPPAVKSIFYGGEHRGYEFVYPKGGPVMIPEVWRQPEIAYAPMPAPVPEETITAAEPKAEPEIVFETEPMPAIEPTAPRQTLPETASPLPLVAVAGVTSLLLGLGLGVLRRRTN
jgi:LPXTG-motif cell wall-anchored protein